MVEIGFVILAVAASVLAVLAYRMGLRDGARLQKGEEPDGVCVAPRRLAGKAHGSGRTEAEEAARQRTILENIDNYDGTAKGQQTVE